MSRPSVRFSIASLIAAVAAIGVALGALKNPTPLVASAVYTLTLTALGAAVIVAAFRPGKARAFGLGFAVFGGVYLVHTFGLVAKRSEYVDPPRLLTTFALEELEKVMSTRWLSIAPTDMTMDGQFVMPPKTLGLSKTHIRLDAWSAYPFSGPDPRHNSMDFFRIGHTMTTLLVAVLGGVFALWVVPRPRQND
jgi:hypothetical protein